MSDDDHKRRPTPRPGLRQRTSPAAQVAGDGVQIDHLTPPQGIPSHVEDDLSTPIMVPLPSMSRTRTDSEPPRMTESEYRRLLTAQHRHLTDALGLLTTGQALVRERVGELREAVARCEERLRPIEADRGELASIAQFRESVVERLVDLSGKDGTNGKVGALRARLNAIDEATRAGATRRWSIVMLALGLLTSAGGVVAWSVRSVTELRAEVTHLRRDVDRHDARPNQPQEPQP